MSKEKNKILIAASGTGGHIFPALSIAYDIENSWDLFWLGVNSRSENHLVPDKYDLLTLNIITPNKKRFFLFIQYLKILFSAFHVMKIIREKKINLVFTTGGYISAPTIIAAKFLNVPVLLHESNSVPGTVTKYFGRFCNFVLTGFKETALKLPNCKIAFTGTPLRKQFYESHKLPKWVPSGNGPLIIVMGGSQGANAINDIFHRSINHLLQKNVRIIHILGPDKKVSLDIDSMNYLKINFTNEIAALLQHSDLVISRSGSGTINELIHTQKPSILIPYPKSKHDHQEKNALLLASKGGSILINQDKNTSAYLYRTLNRIFKFHSNQKDYPLLNLMKKNMKQFKSKNPQEEIIKIINYFKNEL